MSVISASVGFLKAMIGRLNAGLCGVIVLLLISVAYVPTYAATLNTIDITPSSAAIDVGQSQSFVATGTFSDSTTQALESVLTAISASYYNGCMLLASGHVQCWGYNQDGELGNGTNTPSFSPVTVSGISTATALATGYYGSCALLANGQVKCWGSNLYGQLGNNTITQSNTPVTISGIGGATAIAMGYGHTCALLSDKTVKCWGYNHYGQLGDGTTTQPSTPVTVIGISTATAITAGDRHSCARLSSGEVQCWGGNTYGQLGDGTTTQSSTPVTVIGISAATAITAGYRHSCARLSSGEVRCWGGNAYGQLGDGTTTQSITPVTVSGITTAAEIVAGYNHSCARLSSGQAQCWGANQYGQLGDTTTTQSTTPVTVSGISTATALAAGYFHNCALLASGQEQCWGYNQEGQLGSSIQSTTPVAVSGISAATGITAGDSHSCALSGGALQCWGYNQNGQLGHGTTNQHYATPVAVTGISTAVEVKGGGLHTCARLSSGAVQCWGYNLYGQLGDGSTYTTSTLPVGVSGIDGFAAKATEIAAGYAHTCALLTDQTVQCWGDNSLDQLGVNGTTSKSNTPVAISGISGATAITAGYAHTCALLADQTVKCWGYNGSGQLGNGTTVSSKTPVSVSGIDGTTVQAMAISAGYLHTCALLADNTVQCWGDDSSGELGNGATGQFNAPVNVSNISTATNIAAGGLRTCALLANHQVKCWGDNSSGQLGNGTTDSSTTPVSVSGIDGITVQAAAIAAGYAHTCALLSGGAEQCWGDNTFGQLGNGISAITTTPIYVSGAPEVVWSSSNTVVANIDANGVASALSAGSTTITATATDGSVNGSTTLYVNSYTVGGTVSGLTGSVELTNNGGDNLTVTGSSFTFATSLPTGAAYNVSVATQPSGQSCVVSNGSGAVGSADVSVAVTCTTLPVYTVGGTVSGLTGSMELTNNGGDNLTVTVDGSFNFATSLPTGAAYNVSVATQPSDQTCAVTNGSGTVGSASVNSITVSCTTNAPNTYTVSGTVSGLTGSVVLTNNGGDSLSVATDGSFTFATALTGGAAYSVAVATQPSGQSCAVNNGSGTVGSADVTDVTINCSASSVAPLSTASGGGGGGAANPLLLGLLGLILSMRRSQFGHRGRYF